MPYMSAQAREIVDGKNVQVPRKMKENKKWKIFICDSTRVFLSYVLDAVVLPGRGKRTKCILSCFVLQN